jgi:acetyl esterase/lipase
MAGSSRYWPSWLLLIGLGSRLAVADEGPGLLAGQVYADRAGEGLLADVYLPPGPGPFPAVLCVHGGAWTFGNRLQMLGAATALRQAGYVAVSIDYRLAPQHVFPAQLDDCREALGWLRGNAARFKIDPRRIAAWGYSAGGQLVTLMALSETPSKPGGTAPERIKAIVAGGTPTDFRQIPPDSRRLVFWLGGTRRGRPEAYQAASPIAFITPDDPPVFLYHGELDRVVSIDEPKALFGRLRTAGVTAEMYVVPQAGHVVAFFDGEAIHRGIGFLDKHVKGTQRPKT